jgi:CheY-like chemotaxis protein
MPVKPLNVNEISALHVLVVEDNQNMRSLMSTMIRMLGVDSYTQAVDGQDALGALQVAAKIPDVIFVDIKMEPMDGLELTRCIRQGRETLPQLSGKDAVEEPDEKSLEESESDGANEAAKEEAKKETKGEEETGNSEDAEKRKNAMNERQQAISRIPIIIISAFSEVERVIAARDAGANDFLAKPLSPRAILEHLTMVLRHPYEFIDAERYVGPDRRRRSPDDYDGDDRRGNAVPSNAEPD